MKNQKRPLVVMLAVALLLFATGCGMSGVPSAAETTKKETLHNGYLGLTVNLPEGWTPVELNRKNLTAAPEESDSLEKLELTSYEEGGGEYVALLSLENGTNQEDDGHITMSLYAERFSDEEFASLEEFIRATEIYATGELEDGSTGELLTKETALLSDIRFTLLTVRVEPEGEDTGSFLEEYYITKIEDLYFVAYLNYWEGAGNLDAAHAALRSLVTLSGEKRVQNPGAATKTTYYNNYLGISATVPAGKYDKSVNASNFSLTPADTEKLETLEVGSYNDGGYYLDLMTLRQDVGEEDYAELDLYAESYPVYDGIETYLDAMEKTFLSGEMTSIRRTLEKREIVTLNGKEFHRLILTATDPEADESRTEDHYVTQVKELYLILYISYNGEASYQAAQEMLELVRF